MNENNVQKKITIEEACCDCPELLRFFNQQKEWLENFSSHKWETGINKELIEGRRNLYAEIFEKLTPFDLELVFYSHTVRGFSEKRLLRLLRQCFNAEFEIIEKLNPSFERRINYFDLPIYPLDE